MYAGYRIWLRKARAKPISWATSMQIMPSSFNSVPALSGFRFQHLEGSFQHLDGFVVLPGLVQLFAFRAHLFH